MCKRKQIRSKNLCPFIDSLSSSYIDIHYKTIDGDLRQILREQLQKPFVFYHELYWQRNILEDALCDL